MMRFLLAWVCGLGGRGGCWIRSNPHLQETLARGYCLNKSLSLNFSLIVFIKTSSLCFISLEILLFAKMSNNTIVVPGVKSLKTTVLDYKVLKASTVKGWLYSFN